MSAEKHTEFEDELPIAISRPNANKRNYRRAILRFCIAGLGACWLFSHRTYFRSVNLQQNAFEEGHGVLMGKKAEELFLTVPNAASAIEASRLLATKPHLAGSAQDLTTAKELLSIFQTNLGIEAPADEPVFPAGSEASRNATLSIPFSNTPRAWIDTYYPVLNTPLDRALEILGEDGEPVWQANLEEIGDEADPEANKYFDAVPAFHGLSKDGEVEGKLVDANYGTFEDYNALVDAGVDFAGKIVIARYSRNFRGLKIKRAHELGAVGVLTYSDPRDDGSVTEANGYVAYPHGPARNPDSVQRGSVQYISIYPGDPTTPGYPAYENATRADAGNSPSIPSLPISWNNAQVLLKEIGQGGSNRVVRLVNHVDNKVTPLWNAMALIPGHIKNEIVVIGNHRDAWVMGASDPSSGTVSLHEMIRGLGVLLKNGWKPLRSILIASWDGEEYGLIGSTEWGEDFEDFIRENVIAYLNVDTSASGSRYTAEASPSFAHFIRDTAEGISHPSDFGRTLWDARMDRGNLFGDEIFDANSFMEEDYNTIYAGNGFGVGTLGSGSDYTVFLQRIGIASLQFGFSSTLSDPAYHYHSVFDSEHWQEVYGDPGFSRHVAVAQHLGVQTIRLADAIVLPINTTHYAYELEAYLNLVEETARATPLDLEVNFAPLRESIQALQTASLRLDVEKIKAERRLMRLLKRWHKKHAIHQKLKKILCKLKKIFGKKCHKHHKHANEAMTVNQGGEVVEFRPRIGRFAGVILEEAERRYGVEGTHRHLPFHHHAVQKFIKAVKKVQAVNKKLSTFERGFISEEGIKDREWYRHLGVAPGKWLGYGATTFPALTESFTIEKNATLAKYEAERLKQVVDGLVKGLEE